MGSWVVAEGESYSCQCLARGVGTCRVWLGCRHEGLADQVNVCPTQYEGKCDYGGKQRAQTRHYCKCMADELVEEIHGTPLHSRYVHHQYAHRSARRQQ